MGEKEQAPYSWKQRSGPCSVYPSPEGVRETLAWSETHEKIAQSPSCSFLVVQSLNSVWFFVTPWTAARQVSLSFTISQSLLKLIFIESVKPSTNLSLCSPLFLLPSIFPSIRVFANVSSLHHVAKVLEFQLQYQSFQWIFRIDFLKDGLVWSPCSPRESQESTPIAQFKNINSSALILLYGPTLTSIHDYWKNHSFDYLDLGWESNGLAF